MDGNDSASARAIESYPLVPLSRAINRRMGTFSQIIRSIVTSDDISQWTELISTILDLLASELLATTLKNEVIEKDKLRGVVRDTEPSEFDELRNAVQIAVRTGDWTQLAAYRTCYIFRQRPT